MQKILFKIIIILFLLSNSSLAEIVKEIKFFGNKRITNETVLVLGEISKGDDLNNNQLNIKLKKLYETNFFSNVDLTLSNNVLTITLIENPIIEDIQIIGLKNKSFLEKISESIILKNRMSFTEDQLKKDINFIKNVLKSNGFYFAEIKSSITKNDQLNSVKLKLNVDEGEKARIKKIVFIGDKKIKNKKLLEVIASEEHRFWKFISKKVYLNQPRLQLDKRLLINYYKNLGYHKVKVLNSFAEFNDKSFKLVYNIDAGNQYYFNDLKLSIPKSYNRDDFSKIDDVFKKIRGKRFSLDKLNLILEEIDHIASLRMYDFINAEVEENIIEDNKLNFTFKVVDSEKFYIERINVFGNFNTIEEVIRNKLIVDEGDPLNNLLYSKSIDQLKSLGIFKKVDSEIVDGSNENLKIINLNVEERPTGEISLSAGVGTSGSTIGGGITEKNFLGKGINLSTNLEISEEKIKGQFVYSKPNFAYSDNTLFTSIRSTSTDYLTDFGYKVSNAGFSIGTEFEQFENLFFNPEFDLSIEDLKTNSTASNTLKKQEGTYEDFYFNYGLNYDLRNSKYRPSSGNKTSFYQTLPIVSGNNEISNTFVFTQYKTLNKSSDTIGKASIFLKAVNTLDNSDARISKRAQMPYKRLRGFERGKVGPVDNEDFVGGNYVTALNLASNLPVLNTIDNIDLTYFIDVGNVWGVDYDSSIDESNVIRSSTGIGVDVITPIGPLTFSFSQPITKKNTDKTETFRFQLGTTF